MLQTSEQEISLYAGHSSRESACGAVPEPGPAALSCSGRIWLRPSLKPHSQCTEHTELLVVSMRKAVNVASSNQYFKTDHLPSVKNGRSGE